MEVVNQVNLIKFKSNFQMNHRLIRLKSISKPIELSQRNNKI